uniref:NADH-ubiquinone oxidoreductase chain 3 n=1 Tax=Gordionus wolterstorffii TaxID=190562 RepID=A0A514ABZ2_9BILA|nr:NADH dehydrogenase subunit 3 [Gordionus wolterstorffii]
MILIFLVSLSLGLIILLGYELMKSNSPIKMTSMGTSFECGIDPLGQSHTQFSLKFIYISILFIIFDLEVVVILMGPVLGASIETLILGIILLLLLFGLLVELQNKFLLVYL